MDKRYLILLGMTSFHLCALDFCWNAPSQFLCEFTTGYRQDELKNHVIPTTDDAAVVTTNNFNNIDIVQAKINFKAETCYNTYSRAYFNYGRIVNFQHDFISPTLILNPAKTLHKKGRVYDAEYAFGFSIFPCETLRITPLGGYSYHRIELNPNHHLPLTAPPTSPQAARYNYYRIPTTQKTTWRAPFVGMEIESRLSGSTRLCLNGQYLWAHYTNQGFTQEKYNQQYKYNQRSNGRGINFYGELGYQFIESWEVALTGGYQYWDVHGGTDKTTYIGPFSAETKSHLKNASWQSFEISLGLGNRF